MNYLSEPIFQDKTAARKWLEAQLWPDGPVCPHCGGCECSTKVKGKSARAGLYMCNGCRKQFTITVGTIFERSHIPLNKWLLTTFLMCASKKGMSAHQLHRMLGVSYKTAWFMCHRVREAMRDNPKLGPLGGTNKVVEADETYVGGKAANRKHHVPPKEPVLALIERQGHVRTHHVPAVNGKTLRPILNEQIAKGSYLMTDDSTVYPPLAQEMGVSHGTVNHSIEEYVRGGFWHTNTAENYFSIFKRGIIGTYHHVSQQHLKRYLAEFDFRYNERSGLGVNDAERTTRALKGIVGKRLTYRRTDKPEAFA